MSTPQTAAPTPPAPPAPVLTTRTQETRGIWVGEPTEPIWVPESVLLELDAPRDGGWATTSSPYLQDVLVEAGYAERMVNDSALVRGTAALSRLLHPARDEQGGQVYDPQVHGPFHPGDPGTEQMEAAAEAEGFSRCASCGTLPVLFTRLRYHDNKLDITYDNALVMKLSGGYSMFFDDLAVELVLCHDCAHAACEKLPFLEAALSPRGSHTHTNRYKADHPDHYGWDTTAPDGSPDGAPDEAE